MRLNPIAPRELLFAGTVGFEPTLENLSHQINSLDRSAATAMHQFKIKFSYVTLFRYHLVFTFTSPPRWTRRLERPILASEASKVYSYPNDFTPSLSSLKVNTMFIIKI